MSWSLLPAVQHESMEAAHIRGFPDLLPTLRLTDSPTDTVHKPPGKCLILGVALIMAPLHSNGELRQHIINLDALPTALELQKEEDSWSSLASH